MAGKVQGRPAMYPPDSPAASVSRAESIRRVIAADQLAAAEHRSRASRIAELNAHRDLLELGFSPEQARAVASGRLRAAIEEWRSFWRALA